MGAPRADVSPSIAVVGAGITGLGAAWELSRSEPAPNVAVLEAGWRPGGKALTVEFCGRDVDVGPDAFIARVPEGLELCSELGLDHELVSPATTKAYLWTRGRLRPLPPGLFLGAPARILPLARAGLLSPGGLARAGLDLVLPRGRDDTPDRSVGDVVTRRFGREVSERLIDPLLGGIHAGDISELSLAAVAPQIGAVSREHRSLLLGLRAAARDLSEPSTPSGPLFRGLRNGMGQLITALVQQLKQRGVPVRTGAEVEKLRRQGDRWVLSINSATSGGAWRDETSFDGVVIATPAPVAGRLVRTVSPEAAGLLSQITYASVAVVTLAYDAGAVHRPLDGSGFLVPAIERHLLTACTWMSSKWAHLAREGTVLLRASAGRDGDPRAMELGDSELTEAAHAELAAAMELRASPVESRVDRWTGALPQYRVGHLDRVRRLEEALSDEGALAVAGAGLRGVGIPACIGQGRSAARRVLARMGASQP